MESQILFLAKIVKFTFMGTAIVHVSHEHIKKDVMSVTQGDELVMSLHTGRATKPDDMKKNLNTKIKGLSDTQEALACKENVAHFLIKSSRIL